MENNAISEMLEKACPSIQLRLRREILGEIILEDDLAEFTAEIEKDPLVQQAWGWGGEDDWGRTPFHGYESIEAAIRIFCEKGLAGNHPFVQSALNALEKGGDMLLRGIGKPGIYLDEANLGGSEMIRAHLFAQAGVEEKGFVQVQIDKALETLKFISTVESLDQVMEPFKDYMVFLPGVIWPSLYHLRLLAFSKGWRTSKNLALAVESIRRMVALSPIPEIYLKVKSQPVAPGSFAMHDFIPEMESLDGYGWMQWFHRMELMSRLGVIDAIHELAEQRDWLRGELEANDGWFTRKLNHYSFAKWGAYSGLRLEKDWRSAKRRMYDLTFRALVIWREI